MEPIDALVDSGAMGEFMPIAEARRRGLPISPCHTKVGVGDNRSVAAVGKTTINLNMGGCMIARPVILLQDCPYKLILGVKFFYEYACDILFSTGCVQLKMPAGGTQPPQTVSVPFRLSGTALLATCATILPPHTEAKVRVQPDPASHNDSMSEEARWGLVNGDQSQNRLVAHGVARLCDPHDDDYNWVNVINPTDAPVTIELNEVLAHHAQTDLVNMTITKMDTADAANTDDLTISAEIKAMTASEVDAAIAKAPHLKDLDLTGTGGLMSPEQ
jgi:hypothetical protein